MTCMVHQVVYRNLYAVSPSICCPARMLCKAKDCSSKLATSILLHCAPVVGAKVLLKDNIMQVQSFSHI